MSRYVLNYTFCFAAILVLCTGDKEADSKLQKELGEFDGILANMRDICLEKATLKINDLKVYEDANDIPENELCFYKCFYEQTGLLDVKGNLVMDKLNVIPEVKNLDDNATTKLNTCLQGVDQILVCEDLRNIEKCFEEASI